MLRFIRTLVVAGLFGLALPLFSVGTADAAPTTARTAAVASSVPYASHITVPSNYVYNLHAKTQKTLHDYCTHSPDKFPIYGRNANFRGPCARHDMCIQYKQHYRAVCDAILLTNLQSECRYTYGYFDPRRGACLTTAKVYWGFVTVWTIKGLL